MKRLIAILIPVCLIMAQGCAHYNSAYSPDENCRLVGFKPGIEPGGFNGIKWETELSTLDKMEPYTKDPSHGGIHFYLKEGDGYKLKSGKVIPVQYGFWREKFYVGVVRTGQVSDFEALKESVFEKFGAGAKPFKNREEYLWIGKNATMALRYDENLRSGIYYIRSHSMEKKMN
jgi:hypothetical protein